ncbi:MAG: biliverdin-producing heme oxygenase [Burkholderiaceae bacterium]
MQTVVGNSVEMQAAAPGLHYPHAVSIRAVIRERTHSQHQRLDSHPVMAALMSQSAGKQEIALALAAMLGAHRALETKFGTRLTALCSELGIGLFSPSTVLRADLAQIAPSHSELTQQITWTCEDKAALLGVLYVLIGSSLGSKQIAAQLQMHSDPAVRSVSYFAAASRGAVAFRPLIEAMEQRLSKPVDAEQALQAARNTFEVFIHAMDQAQHLDGLAMSQ